MTLRKPGAESLKPRSPTVYVSSVEFTEPIVSSDDEVRRQLADADTKVPVIFVSRNGRLAEIFGRDPQQGPAYSGELQRIIRNAFLESE